jgi:hypothetical protein
MANETIFRDGINVLGIISGSGSINVAGSSEFGDLQTDVHQFTGSLNITGSGTINGSPIITEADTGSIVPETASYSIFAETADTASYVLGSNVDGNVTSASYALTASFLDSVVESASYAVSASHAEFADVAAEANNVYISQSGQNVVLGTVSGSSANFDSITANNLYITETTRSVLYESGSTAFGDTLDDTHVFTGSVFITSSLQVNGNDVITTADTGSMTVESASYAISSSHAELADDATSASYASFATSASHAELSDDATSASYAAFATSASYADSAGSVVSASYALTASFLDAVVESASYAVSASHAELADDATSASYAAFATSASHAELADDATSASYALTATSASHALFADVAAEANNVYISQSGQNVVLGTVSGSSANFDSITANNLYITETTRSVLYESGSTAFGDTLDDTHVFTGSVFITSSLQVNGFDVITTADTGSMTVDSASFATTASYATFAETSTSASHAVNADDAISASHAIFADTASIALNVYISQSGQDATLGTITATNISASGWVSASAMVSVNTLDVNGASYTTNQNVDVLIGTEVVDSFNSGGLCSAEWLACIKNVAGADYRTSKILAVWDNTGQIEYTEYSTRDIGNTNGLDMAVVVNVADIELQATANSNNWDIKVNRITI